MYLGPQPGNNVRIIQVRDDSCTCCHPTCCKLTWGIICIFAGVTSVGSALAAFSAQDAGAGVGGLLGTAVMVGLGVFLCMLWRKDTTPAENSVGPQWKGSNGGYRRLDDYESPESPRNNREQLGAYRPQQAPSNNNSVYNGPQQAGQPAAGQAEQQHPEGAQNPPQQGAAALFSEAFKLLPAHPSGKRP